MALASAGTGPHGIRTGAISLRILTRYLASSFLVTFSVSLAVVTFVMCIGIVFKITDLIARGVSWQPVLKVLIYGFPEALTYSIPISILTACLLVFGRLSSDGEITAMRASGINLWQVIKSPALIALGLTVLTAYINNEVVPRGHMARRQEMARLGMQTPLELLEEGRFITDFPGITLYVGYRKDNFLRNVHILDTRKEGLRREIRAAEGRVREQDGGLAMDLQDVRIDPFSDDNPGAAFAQSWSVAFPMRDASGRYNPKKDDLTLMPLIGRIDDIGAHFPGLDASELQRQRSMFRVELHKRMVLSVVCVAFVILGVPLGLKANRKESSVGIGISLLLVINFYIFVLIAESLDKRPELWPHVITWLPVVLALGLGALLIKRQN